MTPAGDLPVRPPERTGDVIGLVPVARNDDSYLGRQPRRNGRRARRTTGKPEAGAAGTETADGRTEPKDDDTHVDYYI
jgi:hypothetical protein